MPYSEKVLTVVQARMGSSRFPGKVLKHIMEKPVLALMIERLRRSALRGTVLVATSDKPGDDYIQAFCEENKFPFFRGSETDLLDRHYQAALHYGAEVVLKIPSDCPLIDPQIVDKVIHYYFKNDFDFVSNLHPATYPDGNDVEVMSFSALEKSWKNASRNLEREHTTPYIWENPSEFKIGNVVWETGLDYSKSHRWTLDYEEDLAFIQAVFEELYIQNPFFGLNDILQLLKDKPEIGRINAQYAGEYWYRNHPDELKNI